MAISNEEENRRRERRRRFLREDAALADTALFITVTLAIVAVLGIGVFSSVAPSPSASQGPAQVSPTATTPALVKEAPLLVPFTGGPDAVQTTQAYTGVLNVTVSGTGQAQGKTFSDAFYFYTDEQGNSITPAHHRFAELCINSKPADTFVQTIPAYNPAHTYQIAINAHGGTLTFGVCDSIFNDNTGSYTITFS